MLPSRDLNVTCKHSKQASRLLERDIPKDGTISIPIISSLFSEKTYSSRAVISGVPVEVKESELVTELLKYFVSSAKRLERKVIGKYVDCISFRADVLLESATFGYLYLRIEANLITHRRCSVVTVIATVAQRTIVAEKRENTNTNSVMRPESVHTAICATALLTAVVLPTKERQNLKLYGSALTSLSRRPEICLAKHGRF